MIGLHRRILHNSLAQVEKRRGQLFQIGFGELVLQLHDLRGVNYRTSPQRDDAGLVMISVERDGKLRRFSVAFMLK